MEGILDVKLRRVGCPVDMIPRFSGKTYYCSGDDYGIYTLGDGTKCCRKNKGGAKKAIQTRKEIGYADKPALAEVIEKPDDPTKILNPRTKRWVLKTGEIGRAILAGHYV